jgi:CPA2 family monovalent cation:H+ antiporter-2/glutathione-regulated potassium-efflux system protein KefB
LRFSLALPEGSEFSFVLFAVAVSSGALAQDQADLATLVIAVSMLLTPVLFAVSEQWFIPLFESRKEPAYDPIDGPPTPVVICGFGRFGQIVGRILRMQQIPFTALDKDSGQVEVIRRFGSKVYFGNPAREEVLRAAGAETAKVLVVALDDMDETLAVVEMAKRHFRNLAIFARARNRRHAHLLMGVGIAGIIRETFFSSLRLTEMVLEELDIPPESARRAIELFRDHDERNLIETRVIAGDEQKLIQSTQQAAQELMELFEADRDERPEPRSAGIPSGLKTIG